MPEDIGWPLSGVSLVPWDPSPVDPSPVSFGPVDVLPPPHEATANASKVGVSAARAALQVRRVRKDRIMGPVSLSAAMPQWHVARASLSRSQANWVWLRFAGIVFKLFGAPT
jgi:hypothetical protein